MSTINQLTSMSEVASADQVPIYSSENGDARKASIAVIAAYIQSLLTGSSGFQTQYAAPSASGFSVTVNPATDGGSVYLLLTPAAGYAGGGIVLPAPEECQDGQEVLVTCTQNITTFDVLGNGSTVNGAPVAMTQNAFFKLRFDGVFGAWYRVG